MRRGSLSSAVTAGSSDTACALRRIANPCRRRRGAIVEEAREAGIARANQECYRGDLTIAARVLGSGGRPISAVNLAGPNSLRSLDRLRREVEPEVLQMAALVRSGTDPPRRFDYPETGDLDSV